ncbi:MAG TPA: hypothetical protein VLK34_10615 [Nocardioidaceae bacterium]|nr:hypothetical protein [Nocardioidaceae bacterium]
MTAMQTSARLRPAAAAWPPGAIVGVVIGWITLVLAIDAHGDRVTQRLLGFGTWLVLAAILSREPGLVRAQTAVVVVFATLVEYTCSPLLGVYLYRFHNVPAYVPPGHGLVYLAALAIGRMAYVRAHERLCMVAVLLGVGGYAAYGLFVSARLDVLGAFWFACLAGFLLWGPSRGLYIGAAVVVTYLEIVGTSVGTWEWQPQDPTGLVAIGNPPSGAAGGYGWFDLAALLLAPTITAAFARATSRGLPPAGGGADARAEVSRAEARD